MPCHAMPCHAMPCHAMPCHAMPCHAMPCHAMPCHAMPCHAMPCHDKHMTWQTHDMTNTWHDMTNTWHDKHMTWQTHDMTNIWQTHTGWKWVLQCDAHLVDTYGLKLSSIVNLLSLVMISTHIHIGCIPEKVISSIQCFIQSLVLLKMLYTLFFDRSVLWNTISASLGTIQQCFYY